MHDIGVIGLISTFALQKKNLHALKAYNSITITLKKLNISPVTKLRN